MNNTLFQIPVPFKIPFRFIHIVIIGAGGTGGYLFPHVARLANELNKKEEKKILLTLVDGDVIEEKNINRQNFFYPDLNKNKAELLATRHSRLFGIQLASVNRYIEDEETFKEVVFVPRYFPIVVSCVDNHKTRQLIHKVFMERPESFVWIDSGNKKYSGQVVVGYNTNVKLQSDSKEPHMFKLPAVTEIFPEILTAESRFNSEISCDDMAVENIQNIGANILSSTQQFLLLNQLIAGEGELTTYMVRFDAQSGACKAYSTTYENLKQYQ